MRLPFCTWFDENNNIFNGMSCSCDFTQSMKRQIKIFFLFFFVHTKKRCIDGWLWVDLFFFFFWRIQIFVGNSWRRYIFFKGWKRCEKIFCAGKSFVNYAKNVLSISWEEHVKYIFGAIKCVPLFCKKMDTIVFCKLL